MKKKQKTQQPSSQPSLIKVGTELIFSDNKTLIEKVTVESANGNEAILSNQVRVTFDGKNYTRNDGRPGAIYPADEEGLEKLEAYKAYFAILNRINSIQRNLVKLEKLELDSEQRANIIKLSNKIIKLCNLLNI
jgi:hypothetical protein